MNRTLACFTRGLLRGCLLLSAGCSSSNDSASPSHADAGPWNASPSRDGAALGPASDAGSVFLGRTCQRDLDCGMGLVCLLSDSQTLGGEGAPGGYCTRSCTADPTFCQGLAPNAACHEFGTALAPSRYCVLGCEFGSSLAGQKCHGRRDVACTAPGQGVGSVGWCLPRCSSDQDCCNNPGSCRTTCDPVTGLCFYGQRAGAPIGSACSPGQPDICRGYCTPLSMIAGSSSAYVCTEACTVGAYPACGWAGPTFGPAGALCYSAVPAVANGAGAAAGDAGSCVALCGCDGDCPSPDTHCQPFDDVSLALATQRLGACVASAASAATACGGTASTDSAATPSAVGSAGVGGASGTL
jgi:hypothetical protein